MTLAPPPVVEAPAPTGQLGASSQPSVQGSGAYGRADRCAALGEGRTPDAWALEGWTAAQVDSTVAVLVAVPGYGLAWPRQGTSTSVFDQRVTSTVSGGAGAAGRPSVVRAVVLPFADQVREIQASLSLNKTQLAGVLGVSRPTLYEWLDGSEPNAANAERLTTLMGLLTQAGVSSAAPVNARFVRQAPGDGRPTLLEALNAVELDGGLITALLEHVRHQGDAATAQREAREARLAGLGYETPGADERRRNLAANLAQRDWPR